MPTRCRGASFAICSPIGLDGLNERNRVSSYGNAANALNTTQNECSQRRERGGFLGLSNVVNIGRVDSVSPAISGHRRARGRPGVNFLKTKRGAVASAVHANASRTWLTKRAGAHPDGGASEGGSAARCYGKGLRAD